MTNPIRIMIDMETTATGADAGILTLGACTFGVPKMRREMFYMRASLASNEQLGRKIDKATMEWWDKQDPVMRAEAFGGTAAVGDVLDGFRMWASNLVSPFAGTFDSSELENIELWSRGAGFDCEILQHAFYQIFGRYPFDFRKHMCQRTVERLMPETLKSAVAANVNKHHAMYDAKSQADLMEVALRNLSWSGWSD